MIQADWVLGKYLAVKEGMRLQIQAQAYNVFNNPTFSTPGRVLATPATFGYYSDTDSESRKMTIVLRLLW